MKSMNDRKMKMNAGPVDSDGYFPEQPQHKKMARAGEIRGHKYPDVEEDILASQNEHVKGISGDMPKSQYRH